MPKSIFHKMKGLISIICSADHIYYFLKVSCCQFTWRLFYIAILKRFPFCRCLFLIPCFVHFFCCRFFPNIYFHTIFSSKNEKAQILQNAKHLFLSSKHQKLDSANSQTWHMQVAMKLCSCIEVSTSITVYIIWT